MEKYHIDQKNIYVYKNFEEYFSNKNIYTPPSSCIILAENHFMLNNEHNLLKELNCKHISFLSDVNIAGQNYWNINWSKTNLWINYLDDLWFDDAILYGLKFATEGQILIKDIIIINLIQKENIFTDIDRISDLLPNPWSIIWTKVWKPIKPQSTIIGIQSFPDWFNTNYCNWVEKFKYFYLQHREEVNITTTLWFAPWVLQGDRTLLNYTDGRDVKPVDLWFFNDENIGKINISGFFWSMYFEAINFECIEVSDITRSWKKNEIFFNLQKPFLSISEDYIQDRKDNKIILKNLDDIKNIHLIWDVYSKINLEIIDCDLQNTPIFISNLIIKSLVIINTDLGNGRFNWVKIWKLTLENVTLNDCIFNGVDFPKNYQLEDIWDIKKLKDNYRQLKFVMDKNWNYVDADKFYQREKESELEYLDKKGKEININSLFSLRFWISESWNISRKIPLIFGKILTNFWNNWIVWFIFLNFFVATSVLLKSFYEKYYYNDMISNPIIDTVIPNINFWYWLTVFWATIYIYVWIIRLLSWIMSKLPIIWILIIFIFWYYIYDQNIFSEFLSLLVNPFYWFKWFIDNANELNAIELIWFTLYKILYWVILWHLWVALKRVTRR